MAATSSLPTHRRAWRRTDDFAPNTAKLKLVTEPLPLPLGPTDVLIKVRAVALNYRDANIAHGGNPWPVTPNGVIGNDASGEIIAVGDKVKRLAAGDAVAPIIDTKNITGREPERSWLAADEDGVLADYLIFDEELLAQLPAHLDWVNKSILPCAGTTAWSALKGLSIGQTVLIQGTGGVSMLALKLAQASGLRVIMTSSSDAKAKAIQEQFTSTPVHTINYKNNPNWHEAVLRLTEGVGVDLVVENGGTESLTKSIKCTRRGGTVSQVGYLSKQDPADLKELIPLIIDRRVSVRGINAGSRLDLEDLSSAVTAARLTFDDIIDTTYPFEEAKDALEFLWEGRQVGKVVISI